MMLAPISLEIGIPVRRARGPEASDGPSPLGDLAGVAPARSWLSNGREKVRGSNPVVPLGLALSGPFREMASSWGRAADGRTATPRPAHGPTPRRPACG